MGDKGDKILVETSEGDKFEAKILQGFGSALVEVTEVKTNVEETTEVEEGEELMVEYNIVEEVLDD